MIMMMNGKEKQTLFAAYGRRLIAIMIAALLMLPALSMDLAYALPEDEEDAAAVFYPVREVHRVKVGDKKYCAFVEGNAVITAAEISKLSDNELVNELLKRSGFYMKEANCRKEDHPVITAEEWIKKGGSFKLDEEYIKFLREAKPADGNPARMHMDLLISRDPFVEKKPEKVVVKEDKKEEANKEAEEKQEEKPEEKTEEETEGTKAEKTEDTTEGTTEDTKVEDSKDGTEKTEEKAEEASEEPEEIEIPERDTRKLYSTYKLFSPELLFVIVTTKADAEAVEEICEYDLPEQEEAAEEAVPSEPEEILPEYRTIAMTDRSGPALEATLQDGKPVTLEWIEPGKSKDEPGTGDFMSTKLAPALGLAAICACALALIAFKRRKKEQEQN